MARSDGSPAKVLTREQRLAATVVERYALAPPVDVWWLGRNFADLQFDSIPGSCDGLVLGLHDPRRRPLILIDSGPSEVRQRFTAAHEIGHVLLPWHVASSFLCNTDRASAFTEEAYYAAYTESEANRFAAELLVPTAWLDQLIADVGLRGAELTEAIRDARVSAHVACIRLATYMPAGHVFTILGSSDRVILSGQTPGTGVHPLPVAGEVLRRERLDRFAGEVRIVTYGPWRVVWWSFRGEAPGPDPDPADERTAREIEDVLLARHTPDATSARALQHSLSGVIGAAFGDASREGDTSPGSLYTRLRGRFAKQRARIPDSMLDDPDFEPWLRRRATDLAERARGP